MTDGVGFTSFLVSACRIKAASYTLNKYKEYGEEKRKKNIFDKRAAEEILKWEYPIICHPSCLSLLSSIMDSIASAQNDQSLRDLRGFEAWEFILSTGSIKRIAIRTRFIDYYMLKTVHASPNTTQIVVLGAGMDTRPFRLQFSPFHYYELDLPSVIAFKRTLFLSPSSSSPAPSSISHLPATPVPLSMIDTDLTDPTWSSLLISHGFTSALPTIWVLEGLVMYLPEPAVHTLLHTLSTLSSPGSHIMLHTVNLKEVAGSNATPSDFLSSVSAKMVFGVDEPSTLFAGLNKWTNIESFDYQKIESVLGCEGYLTNVTTNSLFTTATFS